MSARTASINGFSSETVTIQGRESRLTLSQDSVVIHRGGIEFRSPTPFPAWTEMTLALRSPENGPINCSGVVISCSGSKHSGYHVSMVFTGMSKQAQVRLNQMVQSPLA
jgi:hypothetical protein